MQFIANIFFKGKIKCLTGLHIGGGQDKLEIGGVDSIVIRDPKTQYPMIPGSSLRGKLRTMIEFGLGAVDAKGEVSKKQVIVSLFGKGADDKKGNEGKEEKKQESKEKEVEFIPTKLIVRDCMPDKDTITMWEEIETELLYTEYKAENTINRLTSTANPRFIERVPAESVFDFEIIMGVYGNIEKWREFDEKTKTEVMKTMTTAESLKQNVDNLLTGLSLIEHNWLGKSGSRGYGKVEFAMAEPIIVKLDDYKNNTENYKQANKAMGTTTDLASFNRTKLDEFIATLPTQA